MEILFTIFAIFAIFAIFTLSAAVKKEKGGREVNRKEEGVQKWSPPRSNRGTGKQENENPVMDQQIMQLRTLLEDSDTQLSYSREELMSHWRTYALLLQQKDKMQHFGGGALQDEAIRAFDLALSLSYNSSETIEMDIELHYHKGILLETMGRGEDAMQSYEAIRERSTGDMDRSIATSQIASVLALMDRSEEAIPLYREAIAMAPARVETFLPLLETYKETKVLDTTGWTALLEEMKVAAKKSEAGKLSRGKGRNYLNTDLIKDSVKSSIYWALFEAADKLSLVKEAWGYLDQAHKIDWQTRGRPGDAAHTQAQTDQIKAIFQPGFWMEGVGVQTKEPIFIIGMMRCGSTLLETMLHSHPEVWGTGENSAFNGNLPAFREQLVEIISLAQEKAARAQARGVVSQFDSSDMADLVRSYGDYVVQRMRDNIDSTAQTDAYRNYPESKISRVVDKMLFNFRNIGFIHMVFPKALIIHIVRDPMDLLLSCWRHKFDDNGLEFSLDADELASNYANYLDLMHHFRTVLPGRIHDVQFEELVKHPERILRGVADKAGLEFDANMLQFKNSTKKQQTHSRSQVRQGLYSSHIGGWRRYAKEMTPIIKAMKKYLPELRRKGALPFADRVNWDLDPQFDYEGALAAPGKKASVSKAKAAKKSRKDYDDDDEEDYDDDDEEEEEEEEDESDDDEDDDGGDDDEGDEDEYFGDDEDEEEDADDDYDDDEEVDEEDDEGEDADEDEYYGEEDEDDEEDDNDDDEEEEAEDEEEEEGDDEEDEEEGEVEVKAKAVKEEEKEKRAKEETEESKNLMQRARDMFRRAREELSKGREKERKDAASTKKEPVQSSSKKSTESKKIKKSLKKKEKRTKKGKKSKKRKVREVEIDADGSALLPRTRTKSTNNDAKKKSKSQNKDKLMTSMSFSPTKARELRAAFPSVPRSPAMLMGHGPDAQFLWDLFSAAHTSTQQRQFNYGIDMFERLANSHSLAEPEKGPGKLHSIAVVKSVEDEDEEDYSVLSIGLTEVYRGMGTALALSGQLQRALTALDRLLEVDPEDFDGLTRRAEVLTALGENAKAKIDIDSAIRLAPSGETKRELLVNRGMILFRNREFRAAYKDFLEAKDLPMAPNSQNDPSRLYNYLGKCEQEFGDWRHSLESQDKAIELQSNNKEAHYDRAISLISASIWEPAIKAFKRVIDIDPSYKNAYGYRGLLYQNLGRPEDAVESFNEALRIDPNDVMVLLLKGVCLHATGHFAESIAAYTKLMELEIGHHCVNRREVVFYFWVRANDSLDTFNLDAELNPYTKMGINKQTVFNPLLHNLDEDGGEDDERVNPLGLTVAKRKLQAKIQPHAAFEAFSREAQRLRLVDSKLVPKRTKNLPKLGHGGKLNSDAVELVSATKHFASWLQLDHHGFLNNRRQHRQYSLAVLHMCQMLRRHLAAIANGDEGLLMTDLSTSSVESYGFRPSKVEGKHVFGWRDMFDVAIRWRQVSEPMDAVWWIDRLPTPKSKRDRIGLNTYMIHGNNKVIRYYPQLARGLTITADLMLKDGFYVGDDVLTHVVASRRAGLANATTLKGLYMAGGQQAFYVVQHVKSLAHPGQELSGTRLTLDKGTPEGWDFSICVPSTPPRFAQYEEEIHFAIERAVSTLLDTMQEDMSESIKEYHIKRRALELFYYWANFGAFTRGTSATGYAAMYAVLLAGGLEITSSLPKGTQLDWEAIFSADPEDFVRTALPWLKTRPMSVDPEALPLVSDVFNTYQRMIDVLNYYEP